MSNVVALNDSVEPFENPPPNKEIIKKLEDLLLLAKDGQILAFAHCSYLKADLIDTGYIPDRYAFHLAAALHLLSYQYAKLLDEA